MNIKKNYITHRSFNKKYICYQEYYSPEMQTYLNNPDAFFDKPVIKYFKNLPNDTSTVAHIKVNNSEFVVKRYNVKDFFHGLKLWLRPSRAMTSWKNTHLLQNFGIPTLKPVAIIENRFGFLRSTAYFIYEYVEGVMCCDYFEKQSSLTPLFEKALISVADSLKKMKQHRVYHRDCHHNNMIIFNEQVLFLDLDHMKRYRFSKRLAEKSHQRDVSQFIEYLHDNQTAKDYFRNLLKI